MASIIREVMRLGARGVVPEATLHTAIAVVAGTSMAGAARIAEALVALNIIERAPGGYRLTRAARRHWLYREAVGG